VGVYDGPGRRTDREYVGGRGVLSVGVGKIGQGGGLSFHGSVSWGACAVVMFVASFVWPGLGSPFCSGTSGGVCAKVVFVAFFVWP
jgi:hypothetical protein